jgi:hypothetical protein
VKPRKRAKINGDPRKRGRESMEIGGRKRVAAHREERELERNEKKKKKKGSLNSASFFVFPLKIIIIIITMSGGSPMDDP